MADKTKAKTDAPMAPAQPSAPQPTQFRYVDRPGCIETFADSIGGLIYDGQTLRIEFTITTLDEMKQNAPTTARRSPTCRLVLTPNGAVDLINRMQQVAAALKQAGLIKSAPGPGCNLQRAADRAAASPRRFLAHMRRLS